MRGMQGWDCSGSRLGISANDNCVLEVSHARRLAGSGRQALLTTISQWEGD